MVKKICEHLEIKRQKTFEEQDKILKQFEKINKKEFGGYSEMSLKGHLLGNFEKREGAKYPISLKSKYLALGKEREKIVDEMGKHNCF